MKNYIAKNAAATKAAEAVAHRDRPSYSNDIIEETETLRFCCYRAGTQDRFTIFIKTKNIWKQILMGFNESQARWYFEELKSGKLPENVRITNN